MPVNFLEDIAATLQRTITNGPPAVVKDLLAGLIASIDMLPDRQAQPIFKLPRYTTQQYARTSQGSGAVDRCS